MEVFERLIEKMAELEKTSEHKAYYYRVSDSLTIMICGMLSSLQNISDIYDWAQEEPIQDFLYEQFAQIFHYFIITERGICLWIIQRSYRLRQQQEKSSII